MNKNRLEAFSDGVFAIIITIMVLEIKIPHGGELADLQPLIPTFISYLLSFIYVGIYWGNHHHMLHPVKRISPAIMWSNMSLLFVLSLIPFATGWMGENHFSAHTLIVYAVLLLLAGVAFTWLQTAIEKSNPFSAEMKHAFQKMKKKSIASTVCYGLAIAMACVYTPLSGALIVGVAIMWLVPERNIAEALKE